MSLANVLLNKNELEEIILEIDSGYKKFNDPFFNDGNKLEKLLIKKGVISFGEEEELHRKNPVLCNVFGCNQKFETTFVYESHYNAVHRYICSECKKSQPSPHLLDLHISEQHDSFFAVQSQRQPMYSCFLEECKEKSSTSQERKDHCIKAHKFPSNFRFDRNSKNSKKPIGNQMDVSEDSDTNNSNDSIEKNPPTKRTMNFSFGHQQQKVFSDKSYAKVLTKTDKKSKNKEKMETSVLENDQVVNDLMESLPN